MVLVCRGHRKCGRRSLVFGKASEDGKINSDGEECHFVVGYLGSVWSREFWKEKEGGRECYLDRQS